MIDNLSIAIHALLMRMLTSLSVDEILLLRYVNWSSYFRGLPFYGEMVLSLFYLSPSMDQYLLLPAPGFEYRLSMGISIC